MYIRVKCIIYDSCTIISSCIVGFIKSRQWSRGPFRLTRQKSRLKIIYVPSEVGYVSVSLRVTNAYGHARRTMRGGALRHPTPDATRSQVMYFQVLEIEGSIRHIIFINVFNLATYVMWVSQQT